MIQPGSIRFRLAAWYFFSLALILALFVAGVWVAMRSSVQHAVDRDLAVRVQDVRAFAEQELAESPGEFLEELQEHSLLGLGGGMLQLTDENGTVLFRSGRLKDANVDLPPSSSTDRRPHFATRQAASGRVRVASQIVTAKGERFVVQVAEPLEEFDETIGRFEDILIALAPMLLLLASLGGFWLSSRALAPVDRITEDARRISARNLSGRLRLPAAKDELQRLTQTLNEMLDRIDAEVKRIVQFTADASHELRAPLTLIRTAAEFSLRRERRPDELADAMRKVARESVRMSRLVDDLLLLARADSNADELQLAPTDIVATGQEAGELAATLAEAKSIAVSTEVPPDPVIVNGNEQLLSRLWLILLDNAVKYTQAGGRVEFRMRTDDSHFEAIVKDTGIGIAPADLPHVWDRFWRADKVRSRDSGGAGLGLAIARWIVLRHQGEIEIGSELGRGSSVKVRLPLAFRGEDRAVCDGIPREA